MRKLMQLTVVMCAVAGFALANPFAPELDGGSAATAVGLLLGAALMIRGRR